MLTHSYNTPPPPPDALRCKATPEHLYGRCRAYAAQDSDYCWHHDPEDIKAQSRASKNAVAEAKREVQTYNRVQKRAALVARHIYLGMLALE